MPKTLQIESINSNSNLTFSTSSTGATIERLRIDSSGNVGIGTDNPVSKLHIKDGTNYNLLIRQQASKLQMFSATDAYAPIPMDFLATSYGFNYGAGNVNALTINSSGNVGIGTTSPGTTLTVKPSAAGQGISVRESDDGQEAFRLDGYVNGGLFRMFTGGVATVSFNSTESTGVHYFSTGNVGIGTESPANLLEVKGAAGTTAIIISDLKGSAGTNARLQFGLSNGSFYTTDAARIESSISAANESQLDFKTYHGSLLTDMTITGGKVGIGTTSPSARLTAKAIGNGYANSAALSLVSTSSQTSYITNAGGYLFVSNDGSTDQLVLSPSGNLGVGTGSPTAKLQVASGDIRISDNFGIGAGGGAQGIYNGTSQFIRFDTASTERLRIDAGGNITIGGNIVIGGAIIRSAAGTGYLSGHYPHSETASTSGVIYTIGGNYVPTSTTLGNMYGIGYGYSGNGGIGNPGGVGSSIWGMYVASGGGARIFLDADSGRGHFTSYVAAANITSGGNVTGNAATATGQQASTHFTLNTGGAGYGLVGQYNPDVHQSIFAMGSSYTLAPGGTLSSFYGVSWSYDYSGRQLNTGYNLQHCLAIVNNGTVYTVIGQGIWTSGIIRSNVGVMGSNALGTRTVTTTTTTPTGGSDGDIYYII